MINTYIALNRPGKDACCSEALTGPKGPVKYMLTENVELLTEEFLVTKIAPVCKRKFGEEVAIILAKALIWAAFNTPPNRFLPREQANRIKNELRLQGREDETCPVVKQRFRCNDTNGILSFVDLNDDLNDGDSRRRQGQENDSNLMLRNHMTTQHLITETRDNLRQLVLRVEGSLSHLLNVYNGNVRRYARAPAVQVVRQRLGTTVQNVPNSVYTEVATPETLVQQSSSSSDPIARLSRVKTLHQLWQEYEFGLNGRKAARDFTTAERVRQRSMYSRRLVFWNVICRMINKGYSAERAVDVVYAHYGSRNTMTKILKNMARDKRTGDLPATLR